MGCFSSQFFTFPLVLALIFSSGGGSATTPITATAGDFPTGFNGQERDALLALKAGFNNRFLDHNWTGLMCYLNTDPNWYGVRCYNGRVTAILLDSLGLAGQIDSSALFNLTELSTLSLKNNTISGSLMDFSNNQKLTEIDLSTNNFAGKIPVSLLNLNSLESLRLEFNGLTGQIQGFNQSSLKEFNVSNNKLSGEIPNTKTLQSFDFSAYSGNLDLCGPPSPTTCNFKIGSNKSHFEIVLLIIGGGVLVSILFILFVYCRKSKELTREMKKMNLEEESEVIKVEMTENEEERGERGRLVFMEGGFRWFELGDLLRASAEGLGDGSFGNCYKMAIGGGDVVVVKRLRDLKPMRDDEFERRLRVIGEVKHPNLLPLLAYYSSVDEKLLVHKFAAKGNLYDRLHGGRGTIDRITFRWSSRLSIARDVARALHHLHINSNPKLIVPHGNLKSSNILLDDGDTVLVSDYGLTLLISQSIASKFIVSYKSPEFKAHKIVSKAADVWSYGCLLLELLTGRVSSHSAPPGARNVVDLFGWVHRAVRDEWTAEIFDAEIASRTSACQEMLKLLQIAMRCCEKSPENRPEMAEVAAEVESTKVLAESEDEYESSSGRSLTEDSISSNPSIVLGYER